MKAILCKAFGGPETLALDELELPSPSQKEVLIDVYACGANFPDALIIQNKYQFKPNLPFSPGGEIAGIVKCVGEKVTNFKNWIG
jgi:NADPH2:quinone reductase